MDFHSDNRLTTTYLHLTVQAPPGDTLEAMPPLAIDKSRLSDEWVSIAIAGEIDLATADELTAAIEEVFSDSNDNLVVDLTSTSFMDSTGLKTLVMADRRFAENERAVAIVVNGGPVSRLIDLSGVDASLRVVSSASDILE